MWNWVRLLWWYFPDHCLEGHTAGIWSALAWDLRQGEFYRPLLSDQGYGGTRYMPLFFVGYAALLPDLNHFALVGLVWMYSHLVLLALACFALLRQRGQPFQEALGLTLLGFGSLTVQRLSLQLRCDFLALGLLLWALWGLRKGRWKGPAALTGLAFFTKFTSLVFAPLGALVLWGQGRRREAVSYSLAVASLGLGGMAGLQLASQGRFGENMQATATAGMSWEGALAGLANLRHCLYYDDPVLLGLTLGVLPLLAWREEEARWWLFWWLLTVTLFLSPGTWINHLLEPLVGWILVVGAALRQAGWRRTWGLGLCGLWAVVLGLSWVPGFPSLRASLQKPGLARWDILRDLQQRYSSRGLLLAENPCLPLAAGQRPFLLDEFNLRVLVDAGHAVGQDFQRRVQQRAFGWVVLESLCFEEDGLGPSMEARAQAVDFWGSQPAQFDCLRKDYQVWEVRRPFAVLLPRSAAP